MDAPTPQTPPPHPPRIGPRPLPLHLATEGWLLQMSFAGLMPALPPSSSASPLSKPLRALAAELNNQNPETFTGDWQQTIAPVAFVDALTRQAKARMDRLVEGVGRYQTHSFRRTRPTPPTAWAHGSAQLLDYGGPADGPAVVFVPSLINRAYILDLAGDRSLMSAAAQSGLRAFLLDWGAPNAAEQNFHIEDYVEGVIIPTLEHVKAATKSTPRLVGYCMGGTLTTAVAILRPDLISKLALLAAPWDFHVDSGATRRFLTHFQPMIEAMIETSGHASVDFLQAMFASLDPTLVSRKFRNFAGVSPSSDAAQRFVMLEDWLNDGVVLAGPVAKETLFGWYGENQTMKKEWAVAGQTIDPARIVTPTLAVIPSHDRIVPPASALALAQQIPHCQTMTLDLGHIGMIAGGSGPRLLYNPLMDWLKKT